MAIADIEAKYMPIEEAAKRLGIHPSSVRRLRQAGRLRQRYIGSRAFFDRAEVERFALTYEGHPGRPRQQTMRLSR